MSLTVSDGEASLAAALGRIPSGLFILTARHGSHETGMLASWVQQCSFEPPLVSVAVNRERYLIDWLKPGSAFAVNVLGEGQKELLKHFSKGFPPEVPAFTGLHVLRTDEGATALKDAHAYLVCEVEARVDAGDHVLVIGKVIAGRVLHDAKPTVHVRKNGLHY